MLLGVSGSIGVLVRTIDYGPGKQIGRLVHMVAGNDLPGKQQIDLWCHDTDHPSVLSAGK